MDNFPSSPTGSQPSDNQAASEERGAHAISPQPKHCPPPPPSITQTIFDRLAASIEQAQAEPIERALAELGQELRAWRLLKGSTRALLASRLQVDADRLLCIENGIASAEQISKDELLALQTLLNNDESAQSLDAAIQRYLALFKP